MTNVAQERLLRLDEVASRCSYSISSVRRAIYRGELRAVRLGPSERHPLRISESELARWLHGDQVSAAPSPVDDTAAPRRLVADRRRQPRGREPA
jgi:excisionase family DNA binding protein